MATPNFDIYAEQFRQKEQYIRELQRQSYSVGDPFGLGGGGVYPGFSPLGNYTPTTSLEATKKRKVLLCMC